jgi:hypothetical protein
MAQAVVSDAGPVDLDFFYRFIKDKRIVVRFLAGPKETFSDRLKKASPITYVSSCVPPLMIVQGCADPYVSPEETDRFVAKLQKVGAPDVTYLRLGKVGHCPHSIVRVPYLQEAVVDFFARAHLTPRRGKRVGKKVGNRGFSCWGKPAISSPGAMRRLLWLNLTVNADSASRSGRS